MDTYMFQLDDHMLDTYDHMCTHMICTHMIEKHTYDDHIWTCTHMIPYMGAFIDGMNDGEIDGINDDEIMSDYDQISEREFYKLCAHLKRIINIVVC